MGVKVKAGGIPPIPPEEYSCFSIPLKMIEYADCNLNFFYNENFDFVKRKPSETTMGTLVSDL